MQEREGKSGIASRAICIDHGNGILDLIARDEELLKKIKRATRDPSTPASSDIRVRVAKATFQWLPGALPGRTAQEEQLTA